MLRGGACIVVVVVASACVSPKATTCDFGRTCGENRVCDEAHQLCVLPDQITACKGLADGQPCELGGAPSTCDAGVCLALAVCGDGIEQAGEECDCGTAADALPGGCAYVNGNDLGTCRADCRLNFCGNGLLDEGELCDDGNLVAGDGCSLQCQSLETCGNGWIDVSKNEQCDDGNLRSHDGCSSICGAEAPTWEQWVAPWHAAFNHGTVYDTQRTRLVLYEGTSVTWERQGGKTSWSSIAGGPKLSAPSLAYDSARHRTIMFGGSDGSNFRNETWEYDGTSWTLIATATKPSPRYLAAMTYDPNRNKTVLFGGFDGTQLGDTWEYNGSTWTLRSPTTNPSATSGAAITFDSQRKVVVMFGGFSGATTTQEWDGTNWTIVTTATAPPARYQASLTFDPVRNKAVLFGGGISSNTANDTWEYNGTSWTQLALAISPPPRAAATLTFDPNINRSVLVGGVDIPFARREDVWEYDGAWRRADPVQHPGPRVVRTTYDIAHDEIVMFAGIDQTGGGCKRETWTFDGAQWHDKTPAVVSSQPPCRYFHATTYDRDRHKVIVFGGEASPPMDDTWEWDGTAWLDTSKSLRPPGREWTAMAYDEDDHVTVMFGGLGQSGELADTWEYDGVNWTSKTPAMSPAPQQDHQMVYDPVLGKIVMYGHDAGATTSETWTYDKGVWAQLNTGGPGFRYDPILQFDSRRGRVVLMRGYPASDSWELVQGAWQKLSVAGVVPAAVWQLSSAANSRNGTIMMFGGIEGQVSYDQTWLYRWRSSTPDEACANGIDDDGDALVDAADPDCT